MTPQRIQRFEVIDHLGTGGMGRVYRARDPQLERDVAVKLLLDPASETASALSIDDTVDLRRDSPASSDELLREARMMARLSHPNVLPVYEVGLSEGTVFVVMEHIEGADLARWLAEPRTTAAILEVFAQAAHGLAAAHARGVVHRDFKPANVLVGTDGRVRVADFGLSRLTAGATAAMVRIDDGRGTPRYMAPELWRGAAATARSDVFAFCTALAEALGNDHAETADARERHWRELGVSAQLRGAIEAGLAEDPADRCELPALIAALEGRPPPLRRWLIIGGAAAAIGAGVVAAIALGSRGDPAAACAAEPSIVAEVWDADRQALLRKVLQPQRTPAVIDAAERILATLDTKQASITTQQRASCVAVRRGELDEPQARVRAACLDRRVLELGATVERLRSGPWDLPMARSRVDRLFDAARCAELAAPPIQGDRRAVAALYGRFIAADELAIPERSVEHGTFLAELERDADQLGERELVARAAIALGVEWIYQDRMVDAHAAFERARGIANEIHAPELVASALVQRSLVEALRGDTALATTIGELRELAARSATPLDTRARLYAGLARAEHTRGNYQAAIDAGQQGLTVLADSGRVVPALEHDLRLTVLNALSAAERAPAALAFANETVEFARDAFGERGANYGLSLDLLAGAMRMNHDLEGALRVRRQGLEIMAAVLPPEKSQVVNARARLARDLFALGAYAEARAELASVLAVSERNQAMRGQLDRMRGMLAAATFNIGQHDEGLRLARQAYEEAVAIRGKQHPVTLVALLFVAELDVELGRLDEAERHLAVAEQGLRARTEPSGVELAKASALLAALANHRGKPLVGERLARSALATLDELHGDDAVRSVVQRVLGDSLLAQHRLREARAAYDQALELARATHANAGSVAVIEVGLAHVDAAEGHRSEAIARARRSLEVLEKFPGEIVARAAASRLAAGNR